MHKKLEHFKTMNGKNRRLYHFRTIPNLVNSFFRVGLHDSTLETTQETSGEIIQVDRFDTFFQLLFSNLLW